MIFAGKGDARRSHFANDLPVGISAQRHKGSHIREGGEISILIGKQDRDHCSSFSVQTVQELGTHAFSIDNDALDVSKRLLLSIARNDGGQTNHQMLIPTMRGSKQGMSLFIM